MGRQRPRRGPSLETRPKRGENLATSPETSPSLETSQRHGKDPERGPGPEISRSRGSGLRAVRLREQSPSRRVATAAVIAPRSGGKRTRRRMMPQPQKPRAKLDAEKAEQDKRRAEKDKERNKDREKDRDKDRDKESGRGGKAKRGEKTTRY